MKLVPLWIVSAAHKLPDQIISASFADLDFVICHRLRAICESKSGKKSRMSPCFARIRSVSIELLNLSMINDILAISWSYKSKYVSLTDCVQLVSLAMNMHAIESINNWCR